MNSDGGCRSRFLPVKKTSDLLLLMSNLYTCAEHGQLRMSARYIVILTSDWSMP